MLSINRWVALGLLAFSSGYGYLAITYRILPFERFLAMKPNTLPIGLAVAGMICSIALLLMPEGAGFCIWRAKERPEIRS